ncbi:MAG: MmcQ/YjbR family DNA-binding protein [Ignavibacteria bacterium]|nr:MmcQ/YjbR family DNA-binding protein [Ignavibacteria bacterium]
MNLDIIRDYCLSFPGSTEQVQWENSLLSKVGGKIFLIYNLGSSPGSRISLKCNTERFNELLEDEFITQAPYFAKNKWISIKDGCRFKAAELKNLISTSYELVFSKLPKKTKLEIIAGN